MTERLTRRYYFGLTENYLKSLIKDLKEHKKKTVVLIFREDSVSRSEKTIHTELATLSRDYK